MADAQVDLAAQLRQARQQAGLTQRELAERTGLSAAAIRDLEQGRSLNPRPSTLRAIAKVLHLSREREAALRRAALAAPAPSGPSSSDGMVRVAILGPLELHGGGSPVPLGSGRHRVVLAKLALTPHRVVLRDELAQTLWGEKVPASAVSLMQTYVSRLRRVLDPVRRPGGRSESLTFVPGGYQLNLGSDRLDLVRFRELAGEAEHAGDRVPAFTALDGALDLWRGAPLAEIEELQGDPAVTALSEEWVTAAIRYARLAEKLLRQEEALPRLRDLAARYPLHEPLQARFVTALAATGRQAAALEAYQEIRGRLADELGIDPGPELIEVHRGVLRQRWSRRPTSNQDSMHGPRSQVPAQLPPDLPGFAGRTGELAVLEQILARAATQPNAAAIVVLSGTAGVGKTALTIHWGHQAVQRFPDGQLYVNLRGYDPGQPLRAMDALAHLLRALGLPGERIPVDEQEASGLYRSLLAGRRMLVLLDNAVSADQVRPLLPGGPGSLALVTSRDRLAGLMARDGAHRLVLDVLAPQESAALLVWMLGESRVAAEPQAASELAEACGHLPLALRIAAANFADQPGRALAEYVKEMRGDRLTALAVDGDPQSVVRTAFDRSYARLPASAAMVFRRLGVVAGPDITTDGVAAVADLPLARAREALGHLASAHLVLEHKRDRYTMHDLLRVYASSQAEDEQPARERLLTWYLSKVAAAAEHLYPHMARLDGPTLDVEGFPDHAAALHWMRSEQTNLVACVRDALEQGLHRLCCVLADNLRGYFYLSREMVDWLTVARCGLAAAQALPDGDREAAAVELSSGLCHGCLGRYPQADRHYENTLRLSLASGWAEGAAAALGNRGVIKLWSGELHDAVRLLQRAYESQRALGSAAGQAINLANLGIVYLTLGRPRDSETQHRRALELHRQAGSRNSEGLTLGNLGEALRAQGRYAEAMRVNEEALAIHREVGGRFGEAIALVNIATVQRDTGDTLSALDNANAALELVREADDPNAEANVLNRLASIHSALGHYETALDQHRAALDATNRTGGREPEVEARIGLAIGYLGIGDVPQALSHAEAALNLARKFGFRSLEGQALQALARIRPRVGGTDTPSVLM